MTKTSLENICKLFTSVDIFSPMTKTSLENISKLFTSVDNDHRNENCGNSCLKYIHVWTLVNIKIIKVFTAIYNKNKL